MRDVLIIVGILAALYIFYKVMVKEPILPWMEAKEKPLKVNQKNKNQKGQYQEAESIRQFLSKVKDIKDNMFILSNNKYTKVLEVTPVNYFLLSQEEQEGIDAQFETWLAQIDYNVQLYMQNRFIDLDEPITAMEETVQRERTVGLSDLAVEYAANLVGNLREWERTTPRYDTKYYVVLPYQVEVNKIEADSKEELQEKVHRKAQQELNRRTNTAVNSLTKANMQVKELSNVGLVELLYYTLNRRKAAKLKFKDIMKNDSFSLYVTANQTDEHIEKVKELIRDEIA